MVEVGWCSTQPRFVRRGVGQKLLTRLDYVDDKGQGAADALMFV